MRGASKQGGANTSGYVLQPKQMVFGADKKLVPSMESNQELITSGTFKGINSYGNMINAPNGQPSSDAGGSGGGA